VSLPDHAFRKSGAQNKTSILFFRKFTAAEQRMFDHEYARALLASPAPSSDPDGNPLADGTADRAAVAAAIGAAQLDYSVFLAEANAIGYAPTGMPTARNDLYRPATNGRLANDQEGSILGEWRRFLAAPSGYTGRTQPDCMAMAFSALWRAHPSQRLDPKYHIFQREALREVPAGWVHDRIVNLMQRRTEPVSEFVFDRTYLVLTISQTGEVRPREPGKGNNPPAWTGDYFAEVSPGDWYAP
jgi:type I restriction enzyme M protein